MNKFIPKYFIPNILERHSRCAHVRTVSENADVIRKSYICQIMLLLLLSDNNDANNDGNDGEDDDGNGNGDAAGDRCLRITR